MVDVFSPEKRSYIMSKIKGKNTRIEMMVRKWLFSFGYRYRVNDRRFPGSPDITITKYKTAIFIHGCFWHQHTGCKKSHLPNTRKDFWEAKFQRNIERDKKKVLQLETNYMKSIAKD